MFGQQLPYGGYPPNGQQNSMYHSLGPLSTICGLVAMIFGGPLLANFTEEWMSVYITENFGLSWVDLGIIGWDILCWSFVFFLSKGFAIVAIAVISVGLIQRMPFLAAM